MRKLLPWVLNAILLTMVIGVSAQDKQASRVPLISDHPSDPEVAKTFENTLSKGGYILNLNRMMANAPKLMAPAGAYASALRYTSDIPRSYRELMIVRTLQVEGGITNSPYTRRSPALAASRRLKSTPYPNGARAVFSMRKNALSSHIPTGWTPRKGRTMPHSTIFLRCSHPRKLWN